jgi:hypothetical protein
VSVGQEPSDRYDEAVDSRGEGGQPGNTASYPHRPLRFLFAAGPPADLRRAGTRRARRTPLEPARTPDGDLEPRRRATPLLACRQRRREAHRRSAAATLGAAPHTNDDSGHPHERLAVDDQDAAVPVDIYARPSPSQFSRPAAVAAATRSRPSAQEVADVLIPDRKLANDNDTNSILGSPSSWTPMPDDPMQVLIVELPDGPERAEALRLFQLTAPSSVRVHSICRVQNLALWYSFVVKRQTMLMREKSLPNAAVEHYEQRLFHGCPAHLVDRIAQQGFNRSFTGATSGRALYGKGVYFARDARYSMSIEYSPPDANGVQNMFLVRAVVGEVCKGVKDALTPAVRYENQLYDSTVDDVQRPSIYVTYNDAQVYPDILIKFSQ